MSYLYRKLTSFFLIPLVAIMLAPAQSSAQENTDACTGLCLLGIQPGLTSAARVREILDNHPWVQEWGWYQQVRVGEGGINWQWNDNAPALLHIQNPFSHGGGRIDYAHEVVQDMEVDVSLSPGMLLMILGEPPLSGTDYLLGPIGSPIGIGITAVYPEQGLWFQGAMHCPYDLQVWTNMWVNVHLSDLKHMSYTPYIAAMRDEHALKQIHDLNQQDCER